jgi:Ca2+-binding EF-hand superfamily protein
MRRPECRAESETNLMKRILFPVLLITTIASSAFAGGKHGQPKGDAKHGTHVFRHVDQNKDGKVTKEEAVAAATERFSRMDTNGDGTVTREEAAHDPKQHDGRDPAQLLSSKDANKDGVLSRDEVSGMPDKVFAAIDANHDGRLTKQELENGAKVHADKRGDRFAENFDDADTNKDGKWTRAEAVAQAEKRFKEMDRDADGVVTRKEATPPRHE